MQGWVTLLTQGDYWYQMHTILYSLNHASMYADAHPYFFQPSHLNIESNAGEQHASSTCAKINGIHSCN